MKTALITGISGQGGQCLARILLDKSYTVVGTSRDPGDTAHKLTTAGCPEVEVVSLDLQNQSSIDSMIREVGADEIYNLAAYAIGSTMWKEPIPIAETNGVAVARLLESIHNSGLPIRFCQASSSEMFGHTNASPQSENTDFAPRNPYGAAKLYAHNMTRIYREHHGLFACSAILFNHESPVRTLDFVTRKVTHYAAKISLGLAEELPLGNLDAERDWGYAGDHMTAMWMMLQHHTALDYVVATGETYSVRELCDTAFSYLGLDYKDYVVHAENSYRSGESVQLVGDSTLLRQTLDWSPKVEFHEMICRMVENDLVQLRKQIIEGDSTYADTD